MNDRRLALCLFLVTAYYAPAHTPAFLALGFWTVYSCLWADYTLFPIALFCWAIIVYHTTSEAFVFVLLYFIAFLYYYKTPFLFLGANATSLLLAATLHLCRRAGWVLL